MFFLIYNKYNHFFEKNIFERLVVYIILSSMMATMYSEWVLREAVFYNPRVSQWIFYGLLAFDYIVSIKKFVTIKVTINPMTAFAFFVFFMVVHGLIVGIYNENPWFFVFNDTIPFLMIVFNVLRMQSSSENATPVDFEFLLRLCGFTALFLTLFGFALKSAGIIRAASFKMEIIYWCIFIAAILKDYKLRWIDIFCFLVVISFGITQMNRTTLAFMGLTASFIAIKNIFKNPLQGGFIVFLSIIGIVIGFNSLPQTSPTYRRIVELQNIDFSRKTGSVGERQQEKTSVDMELHKKGHTDELVGMGMGGTYTMKFTHETRKEYGHAHYSWVWFKMRFGEIGYFYLGILCLALILNGIRSVRFGTPVGVFVGLLCLFSMLYLFTFVNALFLLSGLQFLYLKHDRRVLS